jgi:hypothetical protein
LRPSSGETKARAYASWLAMRERCLSQRHVAYARYGGRGIRICEAWSSFDAFFRDMGERPPGKTLDRYPNKDGDYEPGNCRWATPREQQENRQVSIMLSHDGRTMCVSAWARHLGVGKSALFERMRHGWPIDRVLAEPVKHPPVPKAKRRPLTEWNGISLTLVDWSKRTGVPASVIGKRLRAGWPTEKALTEPTRPPPVRPLCALDQRKAQAESRARRAS